MTAPDARYLEIIQIIRRSEQGITRPFLCKVSDGRLFWVKGAYAGKRSLCCELFAGNLARRLKLPIPDFAVLYINKRIVLESLLNEITDLGAGLVFGSEHIAESQEINFVSAHNFAKVHSNLVTSILLFDWWIKNADRTLGENGGNPNIFVTVDGDMRIIDHNLAFTKQDWDEETFFRSHIFAQCRANIKELKNYELFSAMLQVVAEEGLSALHEIWKQIPQEWLFLDEDKTLATDFSFKNDVVANLNRLAAKEW